MKKRFVILDGSSLIYRAFFALPLLTSASGEYTNAIYGFSNMLMKLMQDWQPDLLAIAFDKSRTTFRTKMFADYKGTRKPTPPELKQQIPLLKELAARWGISFLELDGFEADDIIGTLSTQAAGQGFDVLVVTGDRDELQLIRPDLRVLFTKKGLSDIIVYDEKVFQEEYGFEPGKLIDLKGLMGDTSDNIPGVPGVGRKTAAKLLLQFGSVEAVLDHVDEVSGKKLQEHLSENRAIALLSKQLAVIECQVPALDFTAEAFAIKPDAAALKEFCLHYGMKSVLKHLPDIMAAYAPEDAVKPVAAELVYPLPAVRRADEAALLSFKDEARQQGWYVFVLHSSGKVPAAHQCGLAVFAGNEVLYVDGALEDHPLLQELFADNTLRKVTCGLKEAYHSGIEPAADFFDLELVGYLLDPGAADYDIASLAERYLAVEPPASFTDDGNRLAWEVGTMGRLFPIMTKQLADHGLTKLYDEMELPLVEVLAAMERAGVYVNKAHLSVKAEEVSKRIASLQAEIYDLAKGEFNINSPKQLGNILFDRLDLPPVKKTKSGSYSTNAEVLEALRFEHPIVEKILSYRLWSKLKSTYLDSIGELIASSTGRVHTTFNQMVTATGRLSSSDPNLQNIPVRTEEGREIRTLFEPGEGYDYLLSADYSQIELRILAHLSQDRNFVEAFTHGEDIHARTASEVFGVPIDDITPELRRRAKAVNFGIVYGISDYGLAKDLHIPRKVAAGYIDSYFEKCSGVKAFIDKMVADAHQNGYTTTMFGRRRDLPAIHSTNYNQRSLAERMAMNTPIQGTAADIIKLAMIAVYRRLREAGAQSRIILQVHDELVLEVPEQEVGMVSGILKDEMENIVGLSVPLAIDIHYGRNWAEAK